MTTGLWKCLSCIHYIGVVNGTNICKAFPVVIPCEMGITNYHTKPVKGDHGIHVARHILPW